MCFLILWVRKSWTKPLLRASWHSLNKSICGENRLNCLPRNMVWSLSLHLHEHHRNCQCHLCWGRLEVEKWKNFRSWDVHELKQNILEMWGEQHAVVCVEKGLEVACSSPAGHTESIDRLIPEYCTRCFGVTHAQWVWWWQSMLTMVCHSSTDGLNICRCMQCYLTAPGFEKNIVCSVLLSQGFLAWYAPHIELM